MRRLRGVALFGYELAAAAALVLGKAALFVAILISFVVEVPLALAGLCFTLSRACDERARPPRVRRRA